LIVVVFLFQGLKESFERDIDAWKELFDHKEPHILTFPEPWHTLTRFERLLILRCICPDKLVAAVQLFVEGITLREAERENHSFQQ